MLTMRAMVLDQPGQPLRLETRPLPEPGSGELRLRVLACAVCRTDLHIVDGELAAPTYPLVPGHEIFGLVDLFGPPDPHAGGATLLGADGAPLRLGQRVGLPWLAHSCGHCPFCLGAHENLCDAALFTGHGRDGGFASHVLSVANLTRADGLEFLRHEQDVPLQVHATPYALDQANVALDDLRAGRLQGAAVLLP